MELGVIPLHYMIFELQETLEKFDKKSDSGSDDGLLGENLTLCARGRPAVTHLHPRWHMLAIVPGMGRPISTSHKTFVPFTVCAISASVGRTVSRSWSSTWQNRLATRDGSPSRVALTLALIRMRRAP